MAMTSSPGVLEALHAFRNGSLDAHAHLRARIRLADACEPWLHAFTHRPATLHASGAGGPLGGIPIGVKDIIATADMPTTNGSPLFRGHLPAHDATIVRGLRELSGIVFGKTVTTEFAWRHPGPTVNPFGRGHTPGGSSSGSAAAVAAGIVPLALGTQTVGSIIRPAAFCGIVGLKPSFGTIPIGGVHPFAPSLDHLGLFARSVDDVAYALSLLAGREAGPAGAVPPSFEVDVMTGLQAFAAPRLLLVRTSRWETISNEQQAVLESSAGAFAAAGAVIEDGTLPEPFEVVWRLLHVVLAVEAASGYGDLVDRFPDRTSIPLRQIVAEGRAIPPDAYNEARAAQGILRDMLAAKLQGFDALLMVPASGEAPRGLDNTGDATFCAPWSFAGVPAITLPASWSRNRLPLGLQLIAPWRGDHALLHVAKWAEQILQWRSHALDHP